LPLNKRNAALAYLGVCLGERRLRVQQRDLLRELGGLDRLDLRVRQAARLGGGREGRAGLLGEGVGAEGVGAGQETHAIRAVHRRA